MRLFVAVELGEAIRHETARVAGQLADAFGRDGRRAVAWVAPDKMHLTLRFIGEVDRATAEELARRMAVPFETPAFTLAVGGIGAFPHSGPPRVIWIGITEGADALARVHDEIEARLEGLGVEREDRTFRAHLTLGRVKAPLGGDARQVLASVHANVIGACEVGEVTLFESRLSPHGATHNAVARGQLAG